MAGLRAMIDHGRSAGPVIRPLAVSMFGQMGQFRVGQLSSDLERTCMHTRVTRAKSR